MIPQKAQGRDRDQFPSKVLSGAEKGVWGAFTVRPLTLKQMAPISVFISYDAEIRSWYGVHTASSTLFQSRRNGEAFSDHVAMPT